MNFLSLDSIALDELARRTDYHQSIGRAIHDLKEEDQDRLRVIAETILAQLSPRNSGEPEPVCGSYALGQKIAGLKQSESADRARGVEDRLRRIKDDTDNYAANPGFITMEELVRAADLESALSRLDLRVDVPLRTYQATQTSPSSAGRSDATSPGFITMEELVRLIEKLDNGCGGVKVLQLGEVDSSVEAVPAPGITITISGVNGGISQLREPSTNAKTRRDCDSRRA